MLFTKATGHPRTFDDLLADYTPRYGFLAEQPRKLQAGERKRELNDLLRTDIPTQEVETYWGIICEIDERISSLRDLALRHRDDTSKPSYSATHCFHYADPSLRSMVRSLAGHARVLTGHPLELFLLNSWVYDLVYIRTYWSLPDDRNM